ncbi:dnaJ homolog subfamily A member 3, mitochondrial-like [Ylistrum balloti]|uniref:dnaJ homolog subfamily A member 3, mitochondrial-like n=1 Tax=Ylistrum balloti TaxID=509963 RepID=UPI002905C7E8|nr:dnaJ homolog subfamily A member 3, mitochondrial-like [Ylistrum balloti]
MAAIRRACCGLTQKNCNKSVLTSYNPQKKYGSDVSSPRGHHVLLLTKYPGHRIDIDVIGYASVRPFHTSTQLLKKNFYDVLGVPKNADAKQIKKAYYQLAKKYHPDVNKNDTNAAAKFQEVSEAYEVLSDEGKKRQYDAFGTTGSAGGGGAHPGAGFGQGGFQDFSGTNPEELFRNIFGDIFGKGFSGNNDYEESKYGFAPASEVLMDLTFLEAVRGCNKQIHLNVTDTCPRCNGRKAEPGSKIESCTQCNGTGMETINTGPFIMRSTCRRCMGKRTVISKPCFDCHGKGKIVLRKKVIVPVPAGVEDGQTVRMPVGQQEVFITFKVARSREFRREGADIHSDINISLSQAVLGGTMKIPGVYEDILLKIPDGSHSHSRIRMTGKGAARVNSHGRGDHYIHLKIQVPRSLTEKQRALLLAFAETEKGVNGTINGVVDTDIGLWAVEDMDNGLLSQIKAVLNEENNRKHSTCTDETKGEATSENFVQTNQNETGENKKKIVNEEKQETTELKMNKSQNTKKTKDSNEIKNKKIPEDDDDDDDDDDGDDDGDDENDGKNGVRSSC